MSNPQRAALLWHVADVALCGVLLGFAVGGLVGHFKLRHPYQRWHESQQPCPVIP